MISQNGGVFLVVISRILNTGMLYRSWVVSWQESLLSNLTPSNVVHRVMWSTWSTTFISGIKEYLFLSFIYVYIYTHFRTLEDLWKAPRPGGQVFFFFWGRVGFFCSQCVPNSFSFYHSKLNLIGPLKWSWNYGGLP